MICRKCGTDKPLEAIKKERMSQRQKPICKECHNAEYRAYTAANREKAREQKRRSNRKHREAMRQRARVKASDPVVRAIHNIKTRSYINANPEKHRARWMVREAVKYGRLFKPDRCQHCGEIGPVEGSHDDYSKPLVVEWLCRSCHAVKDYAIRRADAAAPA